MTNLYCRGPKLGVNTYHPIASICTNQTFTSMVPTTHGTCSKIRSTSTAILWLRVKHPLFIEVLARSLWRTLVGECSALLRMTIIDIRPLLWEATIKSSPFGLHGSPFLEFLPFHLFDIGHQSRNVHFFDKHSGPRFLHSQVQNYRSEFAHTSLRVSH